MLSILASLHAPALHHVSETIPHFIVFWRMLFFRLPENVITAKGRKARVRFSTTDCSIQKINVSCIIFIFSVTVLDLILRCPCDCKRSLPALFHWSSKFTSMVQSLRSMQPQHQPNQLVHRPPNLNWKALSLQFQFHQTTTGNGHYKT